MTSETGWLEDAIDAEGAAALTADLVARRSYPGEEAAAQRLVAEWLDAAGLPPIVQGTAEPNRPNVTAVVDNGPGPSLMLNGHIDTVLAVDGWSSDPWLARRDGYSGSTPPYVITPFPHCDSTVYITP